MAGLFARSGRRRKLRNRPLGLRWIATLPSRTGSLSATIGAVTLSSAGSVSLNGDLSKAIGAVTLSATGSLSLNADLSKAIGAITPSGAGSVSLNGDLSKSIGAVTLSSDGQLAASITGDLSQAIGAIALSSAGSVSLNAAASIQLGAVGISSAGSVALNGALSVNIGAISISADGSLGSASTGDLSATIGTIFLSSSATNGNPSTGAGSSRKRRYYVEIDGQAFPVEDASHARAILERAAEVATQAARQQAETIVVKRLDKGRTRIVAPVKIEQPDIATNVGIDITPYLNRIAKAYAEAAELAELRLLMIREIEMQDEEEALLLLM